MDFLYLEPFYGGSHRAFADGLQTHSAHRIRLETLPARFWKWRMRGAALKFANTVEGFGQFDGLIMTNLMSLADLKAVVGAELPPVLVYFHENQLSYPLAPGERMDYQFGFTDLTTALTADRVLFNSHFHQDAFFVRLAEFIRMMPDLQPGWAVETIRKKSAVCYPGCDFSADDALFDTLAALKQEKPLIIWNHRWEFDKDPDAFFAALETMAERGRNFELAVLGENFQARPKAFNRARERLARHIRHFGFVAERQKYLDWLRQGAVVISTAVQENFGLSVIEAMRFGCLPLLPNRLVYPEILPRQFHESYLYNGFEDLVEKLDDILQTHQQRQEDRRSLSAAMARYAWTKRIDVFNAELENLTQLQA